MSSTVGDLGIELGGEPTLVDRHDPVGEREDLVEVLADQQDRDAGVGRLPQVPVHRLDRADVEAPCGRGGDQHLRRAGELAAEHELLQVPAGQITCRKVGSGRRDGVAVDQLDGALADRRRRRSGPSDTPAAVRLQHRVGRDAETRGDAGAQPVFGNVRDPGTDRRAWVAEPQLPPRHRTRPRADRIPVIASASSR